MFNKLLGNAVEMKLEDAKKEMEGIVADNETIDLAFKLVRDMIIFTSKRLIFVDVKGIGKKKEYLSYPYRAITHFLIETAGVMDINTEIKFWVTGSNKPVVRKFKKSQNMVTEIQKAIAGHLP